MATISLTAQISITPKSDILDPQGKAVLKALHELGYDEVVDVNVGRTIILTCAVPVEGYSLNRLDEMCRRFLANINTESYTIQTSES
ncbi:MAG: phosphoribosylformylglycinamidine synthase subunit PurS [bacterium]